MPEVMQAECQWVEARCDPSNSRFFSKLNDHSGWGRTVRRRRMVARFHQTGAFQPGVGLVLLGSCVCFRIDESKG